MPGLRVSQILFVLLLTVATALQPLSAAARVSHIHNDDDRHTHVVAIHQLDDHDSWHHHGERDSSPTSVPTPANTDSVELSTESCSVTVTTSKATFSRSSSLSQINPLELAALAVDVPPDAPLIDLSSRASVLISPCDCVGSLLRSSHALLL